MRHQIAAVLQGEERTIVQVNILLSIAVLLLVAALTHQAEAFLEATEAQEAPAVAVDEAEDNPFHALQQH